MTSERVQARIARLLDEAEDAADQFDWKTVLQLTHGVLAFDPDNVDAQQFQAAAERALAGTPDPEISTQPSAIPPALQPTSFANGRYSVTRFLGEGGKKRVYLAHDAQLDRDVAFAMIKTEGLDEAARTRITREAQAMGRLGSHPHIVTVYDIGEENGQPYLVLPVLPGGDVEGVIEDAPDHKLPIEQAVKIATETCLGLEFSHAKGIIHRDLKPGNVWLAEDGRAMIGDFGLAVAVDRSRLTQAGMMVGTVNYMPPEQAMGGEVTPQSDLYSLGAMLYEMVCGRPPFVGDESVAIIGQHLNTPPVAPTWHRPDCPPGLEALILRLLEKDASKRPASATEVREALEGVSQSTTSEPSVQQPAESRGADPLYRRVFVGRENELRQLQQAYDAAVSGQGSLVMVVGEPGIGKTAVCEQLATYAAMRGGRWLVGHCYEEGSLSLPYLAFVEAMRTYVLDRDPEALRSELGSGAGEVARIVSEVRDKVEVELRDASDPEDDRWRLLTSITTLLRNAAQVQPLVIVLEDLHWADRGTLDLLLHVARNLEGARLLVVGTYRDVEVDRTHPLSATLGELRRVGTFARVPLRGLTVDEVHRMYEAVRGQSVPWNQAEIVFRQTEGHPLFVQEVLRYLVEEGIVVREGGRYEARPEDAASEAVIPDGLRDVVGRRLSHLSEKANQALSIASVIGRDFRLDVLQRVASQSEEEVIEALEEAQERAIIEDRREAGSLGFRFTHAFFRQTLYEEIFAARRIRLHQQVGRALEEVHIRRLEEHASELAEHFSNSTDSDDLAKAVEYGELAARRAMSVYAYGEAVHHLEQAVHAQEILDPDDASKLCDLYLGLGEGLLPAGEPARAREFAAESALGFAEALKDELRAWRACRIALDAGFLHEGGVITDLWRRWLDAAEKYAGVTPAARVRFNLSSAATFFLSRHPAEGLALLDETLELARDLDDPGAELSPAWMLLTMGNTAARAERQLKIAEESFGRLNEGAVGTLQLAQALSSLADTFFCAGDSTRAERCVLELEKLADRTGYWWVANVLLQKRCGMSLVAGRLAEAAEIASRLKEEMEEGFGARAARRLVPLLISYRVGDWQGSEEGLWVPGDDDERFGPAIRPLVLQKMGQSGEARQALHREMRRLASVGLEFQNTGVVALLLEAAVLLGEREMAAESTTILKQASQSISIMLVSIGRLLGDAAVLLDQPDEAAEYYAQALEVCEKVSFRPEIALIRAHLAELLLDHYPDEHDAAIKHLDFAIAEFRDMKMQPALERALGRRGLLKA